jgi:hypothetical protein
MARTLEDAEALIKVYEQNGSAKLYYSLNRKANEMADMLNKSNLSNLDLTDPKDKTFERLKVIWNDAASVSVAIKALGETAGITGDEEKDVAKKPFNDRIAESRT